MPMTVYLFLRYLSTATRGEPESPWGQGSGSVSDGGVLLSAVPVHGYQRRARVTLGTGQWSVSDGGVLLSAVPVHGYQR